MVMVNPGGTGIPILAISARFAPFPPRSSRWSLVPSVCSFPKKYTYFIVGSSLVLLF